MTNKKELIDEIELARKNLEEDIHQREIEAEDRLDELLSKKHMEFCSRCGKKIDTRMDWGGKCLHEDCEDLVCKECWDSEERRFCKKHINDYVKREKERVDTKTEGIKRFTLSYMDFLRDRFDKFSCMDWTTEGFIKKTRFKLKTKNYGKFRIVVYRKGRIFKKPKLDLMVIPNEGNIERFVSDFMERERTTYSIIVFTGDTHSIKPDIKKFVENFSDKKISLFLEDLETNKLYFNPKEKVAEKYSSWVDPNKIPMKFKDILEKIADSMSGRHVISVKNFSHEFNLDKKNGMKILKNCKFLENIKGTDSFILRK